MSARLRLWASGCPGLQRLAFQSERQLVALPGPLREARYEPGGPSRDTRSVAPVQLAELIWKFCVTPGDRNLLLVERVVRRASYLERIAMPSLTRVVYHRKSRIFASQVGPEPCTSLTASPVKPGRGCRASLPPWAGPLAFEEEEKS